MKRTTAKAISKNEMVLYGLDCRYFYAFGEKGGLCSSKARFTSIGLVKSKNIKMIVLTNAEEQKKDWRRAIMSDIDNAFDYLPPKDHTRSADEDVGLECKSGLRYGEFADKDFGEFKRTIDVCASESNKYRLDLCLAMNGGFNIIFDFKQFNESEWISHRSFGIDDVNSPSSFISGRPEIIKQNGAQLRFGVSPDLVSQLCSNWLRVAPSMRSLMFYNTFQSNGNSLDRGIRRGHTYRVSVEQLKELQLVLKSDSTIEVLYGANPADFMMNEDIFTIIVKVTTPSLINDITASRAIPVLPDSTSNETREAVAVSEVTYLEFVQLCPPFCGGGDGN